MSELIDSKQDFIVYAGHDKMDGHLVSVPRVQRLSGVPCGGFGSFQRAWSLSSGSPE